MAREQARKDLPLSTYTEAYWKIDLHNLLHFLELRMEDHAQLEIREYARTIGRRVVAAWCPLTWEAFRDYRLEALTLSAAECALLRLILAGDTGGDPGGGPGGRLPAPRGARGLEALEGGRGAGGEAGPPGGGRALGDGVATG